MGISFHILSYAVLLPRFSKSYLDVFYRSVLNRLCDEGEFRLCENQYVTDNSNKLELICH